MEDNYKEEETQEVQAEANVQPNVQPDVPVDQQAVQQQEVEREIEPGIAETVDSDGNVIYTGDHFYKEDSQDYFEDDDDLQGYSEAKPIAGLYSLLNDIWKVKDSTKISNVNKIELGEMGITIRDCLRIAQIGHQFGHEIFAKFFEDQSKIITDTAMARDGWFTELSISSKRFAEKASSSSISSQQQPNKKWKKMFGNNNQQQ